MSVLPHLVCKKVSEIDKLAGVICLEADFVLRFLLLFLETGFVTGLLLLFLTVDFLVLF